jgi:hypothetical protein
MSQARQVLLSILLYDGPEEGLDSESGGAGIDANHRMLKRPRSSRLVEYRTPSKMRVFW